MFEGFELPSDEDVRKDTHREKVSIAKKAYYESPLADSHRKAVKDKFSDKEWLAARNQKMREDRGVPIKFISPTGEELMFQSGGEADEHFGFHVSHLIPLQGAKRMERRKLKNWIVIRLDGTANPSEIQKLKEIVQRKINPPKNPRNIEAWKKKMADWRGTPEGKKHLKERGEKSAAKISKANSQPIMTPDGEFPSQSKAAEYYGITKGSMAGRMREHPDKYYKIDENGNMIKSKYYIAKFGA